MLVQMPSDARAGNLALVQSNVESLRVAGIAQHDHCTLGQRGNFGNLGS